MRLLLILINNINLSNDYAHIIVFLSTLYFICLLLLVLPLILAPKHSNREKLSAYECGFDPFSLTRNPFDIKFYIVAILFLIFDLEIILIFP